MSGRGIVNGIRQLDNEDRRTPNRDRLRDLQVKDLLFHIKSLNAEWTRPAR